MSEHVPADSFLHALPRLRRKGERIWYRGDGADRQYYTWDPLHEEVEVYNARQKHLGAVDAVTGQFIKDAKVGRKLDL